MAKNLTRMSSDALAKRLAALPQEIVAKVRPAIAKSVTEVAADARTLADEYERDRGEGLPIALPKYYYPGDDPAREPRNSWRSHGHLFIGNWINQTYQMTPFDESLIGTR